MAKESSRPDARLLDLGFDPAAPPEQALAKLTSLRGAEGVTGSMVAQALGMIASAEAARMLLEMEHGATGALRREIRRALFKLRQHGVEIPSSAASLSPSVQSADLGLSASLSSSDADGARIVWLLKSRSGGGLRRLWGLVSSREGLLGATLEPVTRKEFRSDRAEVERRAGTPLIDADWRLADFILVEAYRNTPENRLGRVGNFLALRAELIDTAPARNFHHPIYDELAAALPAEPSADLMKAPEIGAYQLPPEVVKHYADEVTNLQQSVLVLNRMQQEERVRTVVERAMDDLLKDAVADRLRRHLEDTAYFYAHSGKPTEAGWAAAAAARLRDHTDLKRSPFFEAFMRAQLGAILAEQQEEQRDEPRLIMTPAEMMRARQAAQARMRGR